MKKQMTQNSKNKIPNTNSGITLIALIITIIVMLILVAVTISMAVNGGLFSYAGKAAGDTQNAINEEQKLADGGLKIDGTWYNSIDEYLGGDSHNWTRSGDTFSCAHCNTSYTMGDVVNYTATGTSTMYLDRLGILDEETNEISITGESAEWVVLGREDADGDGKYEALLITTATPVGIVAEGSTSGLPMYGAAAYNNGPSEVNRICKDLYSNSTYGQARGMTIEDVNAALNYTPDGGMYHDGTSYGTTGDFTTKLNSEKLATVFNSLKVNGTKTPDPNDTDSEADLGAYELKGYYYYLSEDGTGVVSDVDTTDVSPITTVERNLIFGENADYVYFLASRGVYAIAGYACFGPGRVYGGGADSYFDFFGSNGGEVSYEAALRPVVSLTSTLPAVKTVTPE